MGRGLVTKFVITMLFSQRDVVLRFSLGSSIKSCCKSVYKYSALNGNQQFFEPSLNVPDSGKAIFSRILNDNKINMKTIGAC